MEHSYHISIFSNGYTVNGNDKKYSGKFSFDENKNIRSDCPGSVSITYPHNGGPAIGTLALPNAKEIEATGLRANEFQFGDADYIALVGLQVERDNFVSLIKGNSVKDLRFAYIAAPEIRVGEINQMRVLTDKDFSNTSKNIVISKPLLQKENTSSIAILDENSRDIQIYTNIIKGQSDKYICTAIRYAEFYKTAREHNFLKGTDIAQTNDFINDIEKHFVIK